MVSYSKECIETAQDWINGIDDIDSFLDDLIEVNEKCTSSPSLEEFCANFSLSTTENLISPSVEFLQTIDIPIEHPSAMSITKDISRTLISLFDARDKEFMSKHLSLPYNSEEIRDFEIQDSCNQYQCAA